MDGGMSYEIGKILWLEVFDAGMQMGVAWEDLHGNRHAFRLGLPVQLKADWDDILKLSKEMQIRAAKEWRDKNHVGV